MPQIPLQSQVDQLLSPPADLDIATSPTSDSRSNGTIGHSVQLEQELESPVESRPLPYLPFEILEQIFALSIPSLPPHVFDDGSFQERASVLRTYTLISSTWREFAERELYRWPVLLGPRSIRAFVKEFDVDTVLGMWVEGLRIDGAERTGAGSADALGETSEVGRFADPLDIIAVLRACPRLTSLWLRRVQGFKTVWLASTPELEHLKLHYLVDVIGSKILPYPPLLSFSHLSLESETSPGGVQHSFPLRPGWTEPPWPSYSRWYDFQCPATISFVTTLDVPGMDVVPRRSYFPPSITPYTARVFRSREDSRTSASPLPWTFGTAHWHIAVMSRLPMPEFSPPHLLLDPVLVEMLLQYIRDLVYCIIDCDLPEECYAQKLETIYLPSGIKVQLGDEDRRAIADCERFGVEVVYEEAGAREEDPEKWIAGWRSERNVIGDGQVEVEEVVTMAR